MYSKLRIAALFLMTVCSLHAQDDANTKKKGPGPADIPTASLIQRAGPSFRVPQSDLHHPEKLIAYGDQRFTDPGNVEVTNPVARRLLVQKIAAERPDAVLMSGDVPYSGDVPNDYAVYRTETQVWRDEHLHVYPALGNHEFHGDPNQALENWWNAFPEMRNRRWYSVELGKVVYTIALDSDASLSIGSDQMNWLDNQLKHLPKSAQFVFISLHHPPVADFQMRINVSHNPRANEIILRDYLEGVAPRLKAKIIVVAGHIHNYERFYRGGVTYLVSGGGAAKPVPVERKPEDLYQDNAFPNYHFVEFTLKDSYMEGTMYRLVDPTASDPVWEIKDTFRIEAK